MLFTSLSSFASEIQIINMIFTSIVFFSQRVQRVLSFLMKYTVKFLFQITCICEIILSYQALVSEYHLY